MNGRSTPDPVNKSSAVGEPVTQENTMSVKGDKVECETAYRDWRGCCDSGENCHDRMPWNSLVGD